MSKSIFFIFLGFFVLTAYQNCAPVRFTPSDDPLSKQSINGEPGNSAGNSCPNDRPNDFENVACLVPFSDVQKALIKYNISCSDQGEWSRQQIGDVDYSLCPQSCDQSKRPSDTSLVACQSPNESITSAIQRYTITCDASYNWVKIPNGAIDFSSCPQSCDSQKKPADYELVKCLLTNDLLSRQNYQVSCNSDGNWTKTPTTLDTSKCPSLTCDNATKPPTTATVACPEPFQNELKSIESYQVTCLGQTWVKTLISKDNSACSKNCVGTVPADRFDKVACQTPYQTELLAEQKYKYVCDTSTGQYSEVKDGPVNYSACPSLPLTCDNATKPPTTATVACPEPFQNELKSIESYQVICSGQTWVKTLISKDNSACSKSCSGTAPAGQVDKVACQAPYQTELLAEQKYKYVCDTSTGQYSRVKDGVVNYSGCPNCPYGYKYNSTTKTCEIEKIACTVEQGCSRFGVGYKCVYLCNRYKGEMCQTFMGSPSVSCQKPDSDGKFNIYSYTANYSKVSVSLPHHSEQVTSGGSYAITDASLADDNLCINLVSLDQSKPVISPYYPNLDINVRSWYPKSKFGDVTTYEDYIQRNIDRWTTQKNASNCVMTP